MKNGRINFEELQNAAKEDSYSNTNVIPFPKRRKQIPILEEKNPEFLEARVEASRKKFVDFLVEKNVNSLGEKLAFEGVSTSGPLFKRDFFLVKEAVRSMILRSLGLDHKMQFLAEQMEEPKEQVNLPKSNRPTPPDIVA